jgi:hypothetical protein
MQLGVVVLLLGCADTPSQVVLTADQIDPSGTADNMGTADVGTFSSSNFTVGANSDEIVVEMTLKGSISTLPSTIAFGNYTLTLSDSFNSTQTFNRSVAFYNYGNSTTGISGTGSVNATFSSDVYGYSLSFFSLGGVNTSASIISGNNDGIPTGTETSGTNSITLNNNVTGSMALIDGAVGGNSVTTLISLAAPSNNTPSGDNIVSIGTNNNSNAHYLTSDDVNYLNGTVADLAAGNTTFTTSFSGGTASKYPLGIEIFTAAVPEPSTSALLILGGVLLTGMVCHRKKIFVKF